MNFKLVKIDQENESNFECSKIGGSPVFPMNFLEDNGVYDCLFVAQINLAQIKCDKLPSEGFLYFFLNIDEYPYEGKVIYTNEQVVQVYQLINEDFDEFGDPSAYQIVPTEEDAGLGICTPFDENLDLDSQIETFGAINLLELDSMSLPQGVLTLGQPDGWYLFVIDTDSLAEGDFSQVTFLAYGS